jgi:hypothetical protein
LRAALVPDQWNIRKITIRTGIGTPMSHNKPYFMGILLEREIAAAKSGSTTP